MLFTKGIRKFWQVVVIFSLTGAIIGQLALDLWPVPLKSGTDVLYTQIVRIDPMPVLDVGPGQQAEANLLQLMGTSMAGQVLIHNLEECVDMNRLCSEWDSMGMDARMLWLGDRVKITYLTQGTYNIEMKIPSLGTDELAYLEESDTAVIGALQKTFKDIVSPLAGTDVRLEAVKDDRFYQKGGDSRSAVLSEFRYAGLIAGAASGLLVGIAWAGILGVKARKLD